MRIAQVSTLSAPVRRDSGGSVEALIWLLTREMSRLGHQVTVFASGDSEPAGELVAALPGAYGAPGSLDDWQLCEWVNLCRAVQESGRFDIVHTHAYLWALPLERFCKAPMVHTLHIVPDENTSRLWTLWPQARVTAVSKHQWSEFPDLKPTAIVPHGVDLSGFTFHEKPDDYLCYLGRFVSGKGPIQAIETARELGMRLRLAGPENAYFRKHVAPLVDGRQIEYIGFVEGAARDRFLGGGRALLYPIQYPEAFGLVLVEAMLCGTPVAAMNLGAVPELVQEGLNGGLANSMAEFPAAVRRCLPLDRRAIRQTAEERYSAERMAREYLRLYEEVVASSKL